MATVGTTGVWLIGARGSVATTAIVGAASITAGLADQTGLVTALAPFATARLPALDELVFGGHDLNATPLVKHAEQLAAAGVLPATALAGLADRLAAAEANLRPGVAEGHPGETPRAALKRLRADLEAFRACHSLARVVVINVASTEPPLAPDPAHQRLDALEQALDAGRRVLPASSLYAYAAFRAGCPYIDFTPSTGARLPALDELARTQRVPHAGRDGKTGETLLKTALAPMFADRALRVRSWAGTNLLGGGDGATLAEPDRVASKLASKRVALGAILDYPVDEPLHIQYVPDLGQWKTAWDHVTFEGFLGVRMRLQLTWEGCDSTLAAPLVLDLARLVARAHVLGETGGLTELAFFFKDPIGDAEHRLAHQFERLCAWAARLDSGPGDTRTAR
jgi:myo-inositol-1-phosphate synthase